MRTEFVPQCVSVTILFRKEKNGIPIGEEVTPQEIIWRVVEDSGRILGFGALLEDKIREKVEVAEEREIGG